MKQKKMIVNLLLIGLLVTVVYMIYSNTQSGPKAKPLPYSQFIKRLSDGQFAKVMIDDDKVTAINKMEQKFVTIIGRNEPLLVERILKYNKNAKQENKPAISLNIKEKEKNALWKSILFQFLGFLVIGLIIWFVFIRQMQGAGNKAFSFGKSRARLTDQNQEKKVTFKDVSGVDEAKTELEETVAFLKDPKKFERVGARLPRGVVLIGAPGTGKTLLAKAVAGEAEVPFFSISGSEFVEMFVGVGASRVRDLFKQGKENSPCIIFIDEIDAVGRQRGAGLGGGHDEREQTLNQLLVEMDGFETNSGIILMAATNRPDVLDKALLRPGRFDRQVVIDFPDIRGREGILKIHSAKIAVSEDVEFKTIARATPGFTGADLANLVNEAALLAARRDRDNVVMDDVEDAKDKILMGSARTSMVLSDEEKYHTAIHESGHALISRLLPTYKDELHKVTIIPRGRALGVTHHLPEETRKSKDKDHFTNQLRILLGGRAAEEIIFGEFNTGASNDIQKATEIARNMVCSWGMSDLLGPVNFSNSNDQIFLGREISQHRDYSEETAKQIDKEVYKIIGTAYQDCKKKLTANKTVLKGIADELCKKETLDSAAIATLMKSLKRRRKSKSASRSS